jgi:hypothetical protein
VLEKKIVVQPFGGIAVGSQSAARMFISGKQERRIAVSQP